MLQMSESMPNRQGERIDSQQRCIVHHGHSFSNDVTRNLIDLEPIVQGLHELSANLFSWHRSNVIV
jgi:hypothetical protein